LFEKDPTMAFAIRNMSVLAYANGFTLWHYKAAADDQIAVAAPAFFNDAGDMLASGDMVMVSAKDGGRMLCVVAERGAVHTTPLG
jgi:predicted lipoprotein with Yx(FWY)xxD motif